MIVNLTPHPIRLYGWDVPDRITVGDHQPTTVIEPSGTVARIGEIQVGTGFVDGVTVEHVEYTRTVGLPPYAGPRDSRDREVWYVVSLALALAMAPERGDLLVPYKEIRNPEGTIVGCRSLARPV